MEILFQDELLNTINNYTLSNLPHSILLTGESGCGKHTLCNYIAEKFNLPMEDISDKLSLDLLSELNLKPLSKIYLIDSLKINIKDQNMILKFVEEPPENCYIIILTPYKRLLLNTIVNRCIQLDFKAYTKEELTTFTSNNKILNLIKTPGEVELFNNIDIDEITNFIYKILDKINVASFPNTLSISNKIAFNNEKDKYNFNAFINVLLQCAFNTSYKYADGVDVYNLTNTLVKNLTQPNINKRHLFEHYLCELWELKRK